MLATMLLRHVLAYAITTTAPDIKPELALQAAGEVLAAATPDVPIEILAATAYEESKFQSLHGKRSAVCGVMQTAARGRRCTSLVSDRSASYRDGVRKLREARAWCGARGPRCQHSVYGGGNAWRSAKPQRYAGRVLARAAAIRAVVNGLARDKS